MSGWLDYELDEIIQFSKKQFKPDSQSVLPYIGLEHIEAEQLRLNGQGLAGNVASNKFYFEENDILFGKLRPYLETFPESV